MTQLRCLQGFINQRQVSVSLSLFSIRSKRTNQSRPEMNKKTINKEWPSSPTKSISQLQKLMKTRPSGKNLPDSSISYKVAKTTCSLQKGDKVCFTRPLMQEFRAENLYDNKRHQKHGHSLSVKLYILRSAYIFFTISNHYWNSSNFSSFKSLLIM